MHKNRFLEIFSIALKLNKKEQIHTVKIPIRICSAHVYSILKSVGIVSAEALAFKSADKSVGFVKNEVP